MFKTMAEVKQANKEAGQHWSSKGSMRFFNSRVESKLIGGRYFVTSEIGPDERKLYTVREVNEEAKISTVGEFQGHSSYDSAMEEIQAIRFQV